MLPMSMMLKNMLLMSMLLKNMLLLILLSIPTLIKVAKKLQHKNSQRSSENTPSDKDKAEDNQVRC